MKLFDDIERADASGPQHDRIEFAYLNITSIPMAARIREFLEEAFANYSGDDKSKTELRKSLRSDVNKTHVAAVFELFLHEFSRRRSLEPQANTPLGSGFPDQAIRLRSGGTAIVEARMLEPGNNAHYDRLCDTINAVTRPGVLYYLRIRSLPSRAISSMVVAALVRKWVDKIDVKILSPEPSDNAARALILKDGEAPIVDVVPYRQDGSEGGLGRYDVAPSEICTEGDIRHGLEKKNRKYRDATVPYVIAVCSGKMFATDDTLERALFGEGHGEHRGFFVRSERSNVSAVLACQRFKPSSLSPRMQLYLNPNAARPLGENPFGCEMVGRRLARTAGASVNELMGLPLHWPGD